MRARVLVAASSKSRARALAQALKFTGRTIDTTSGKELPEVWAEYRLLICETGPRLKHPAALLRHLRKDAHVVLVLPNLDARWVAYYMQDKRVSHFVARDSGVAELQGIVERLETGSIFGMDRFLPPAASIVYRRLNTYKMRCDVLDEIDVYCKRLRGQLRRNALQVTEELLMNAMYQAPVDDAGNRLFAEIEPRLRIRRKSPRPISLRYAVHDNCFFVSVRDRFGSFKREDLAHYLLRCVTEETQIEEKKLGAGLGLYLVTSASRRMVINILPGRVSEFICVLEPPREQESQLKQLSVTTQMPTTTAAPRLDSSEVKLLSEDD